MTRTTPTVTPGYDTTVDPAWRSCGVFTRSLSSFTEDRRKAADAAGFRGIAVQLDHTDQAQANRQELAALRGWFTAHSWVVAGWGTAGQGTDAFQDGARQRQLAEAMNLAWVVNIEAWGEYPNQHVSNDWMRGWISIGPTSRPVMLSCLSSVTAGYARTMDYQPFVSYPGAAVSPQVYCASDPNYTLPAMRGSFSKSIVPADQIVPTCNVVAGQVVPPRYRNWRGQRWLYCGEDTQAADFSKVLVC